MGLMRSLHQDPEILKQSLRPGTWKRTLRFAAPYTAWLAAFLVVVLLDAGVGVVNPLIYRSIIDQGILRANVGLIVRMALLLAALGLSDGALGLAQTWLAATIGARIVLKLRIQLFDHIQQMPLAFFTHAQTGALISRLENDMSGARTAYLDILSNGVGNLATIALILAAMAALSWRITLVALALGPLFVFPARTWGRRLQGLARESMDLNAKMTSTMAEHFNASGAQLSQLFGRPREDSHVFAVQAERVQSINVKRAVYGRLFFTSLVVMATCATALAYGWGGVLAARNLLDVGTVVALASYLVRLYAPLIGISNIQVSVMTALVSFDRVFELMDLKPMICDRPNAVRGLRGPARVEFVDVSFRYPAATEVSLASVEAVAEREPASARPVLEQISFTVERGALVALVGPSGAGKTTLTQLLPRLYDVSAGGIFIDGTDIRELALDSLRNRIGVVTQDAHLFHDTIRANLHYARPEASEAELWTALENARLDSLVRSFPRKLETAVGERGYRFSGGEKQRLAIARVLLKAPDIVILDEATAHLDSASEAAIQQALEKALAGRTSLVIAHRLSTILRADEILVLESGRIVQRGRHPQLAAKPGLYQQLYRTQFSGAAAGNPGLSVKLSGFP